LNNQYLHADHLGSASLTTDASGHRVGELRYTPYGVTRYTWGATPTDHRFTDQQELAALGVYDYGARMYSPSLGRFLSADSIVPGAAAGAGGGAATLGYDPKTRLTLLTVNLAEFAAKIGEENREIAEYGWFFQWDEKVRQQHNVPMGPANPQVLNRYAYCLSNPLRYVDPTGRYTVNWIDVKLDSGQVKDLLIELDWWIARGNDYNDFQLVVRGAGIFLTAAGLIAENPPALLAGLLSLTADATVEFTVNDLQELRYQLAMQSKGGTEGVHLIMGSDPYKWGITINAKEVINRWTIHPILTANGIWNLTPMWAMCWWVFDYSEGPVGKPRR